jgi:hypothetical protein
MTARPNTMPSEFDTKEAFFPPTLLKYISAANADPTFDNETIKWCISRLELLAADNMDEFNTNISVSEAVFHHRARLIKTELLHMWEHHSRHLNRIYPGYEVRIDTLRGLPYKAGRAVYVDKWGEIDRVQQQ